MIRAALQHRRVTVCWDLIANRQLVWILGAALVAAAALYALLSLGQRSLWVDEALVANTILGAYFDPEHLATTPVGFAVLIWLVAQVAGTSEAALRLVPLMFWAGAVVLSGLVARQVYTSSMAGGLAALLVGTNFAALTFARILKPYTADMFFCVLVLGLALLLEERPTARRWALYGLVLVLAPLFSFISLLAVGSAAVFLLLLAVRRDRRFVQTWFITHAAAGLLLGAYGLFFLLSQRASQFGTMGATLNLDRAWQDGFAPPGSIVDVVRWYLIQAGDLGRFFFHPLPELIRREYVMAGVLLVMLALGIIGLARRRRAYVVLVVGPFALLVLASAWQVYPLSNFAGDRLLLGLLPGVCVLAAGGLGMLAHTHWFPRIPRLALAILAVTIVLVHAGRTVDFASMGVILPGASVQETRELIRRDLLPALRPGDLVYVYYGAVPAFQYYAPDSRDDPPVLYGTYHEATLGDVPVVFGGRHRAAPAEYSREFLLAVQAHEPSRVWVLFSHVSPLREKDLLTAVFPEIGSVARNPTQVGAWLYLIDAKPPLAPAPA